MRILVHDYSGHPFQVELSRWLSRHGHQTLHLYSASFQTPKGRLEKSDEDPDSFQIAGLKLKSKFQKYSFVRRRFQELEYGRLLCERIKGFSPDLIISSNTPLDAQNTLWNFCKKNKIPTIFWLQDIYSVAIKNILREKFGLLGALIGKHYEDLEKKLLSSSDAIVSISPDFINLLNEWKAPSQNIHVIPNWAPLAELPIFPKENSWSKENNLESDFVFLYSGTLGLKHDPELLLKLAEEFKSEKRVKVLVISEGLGADWLNNKKAEIKLDNLIIMNYQDFSVMPKVLASADVLIAVLEQSAGVYSVPSKVLTYLCAGKAILLSVPADNLAARVVSEAGAGRLADNKSEFLRSARELFSDELLRTEMGQKALNYAQRTFDIDTIGEKFNSVIRSCLKKSEQS
ncbi:MAG: glycosyltransferase family 4 protein [Candidatus Obscuribacterales bacterium]|nr:glycosyltransferase family 4 protein [Candidatus Obscuribacterales bacterium]